METPPKIRIESIDLLRGIIMVIMALDHVRHYVHYSALWYSPTDPEHTTWAIFFTRWVTHYCAPVFCFLAGLSAWFSGRSKPRPALARFLFTRGLWLVFMEFTLINLGWTFDPELKGIMLMVFWSLGMGMVCLAGLIYLPYRYILFVSLGMILGHNLLDSIPLKGNVLWAILHEGGPIFASGDRTIFVAYPLIPWVAVMAVGYCFGPLYQAGFDAGKRRHFLRLSGLLLVIGFFLVRGINIYGDSSRWVWWPTTSQTAMDFLDPGKYPPSLLFLCMTLGPALVFLSATESLKGRWVQVVSVFGRVPFFYYLAHIVLIHGIGLALAQWSGIGWQKMIMHSWFNFEELLAKAGYGYPLWVVYLVWLLVVVALYFPCLWFDQYKRRNARLWWLSYL